MGSRKIFAVKEDTGFKKRKKKSSDSDSDTEADPRSNALVSKLDLVYVKVSKILDVSPNLPMPVGLLAVIKETFSCHICLNPISPPAIFGRCCRRVIGCQSCVNEWYRGEEGMSKQCPLCRGERGLADSTPILGLDDFLFACKRILGPPPTPMVPPPPANLPDI